MMINLKEMLLERQVNQDERLGCLMAMVDKSVGSKILEFNKKLIGEEDLYHKINDNGEDEFGREKECHVTIRYGFTKDLNELDVRQLLKGQQEFLIETDELNTFDTNPEFDVVKFSVISPVLTKLNNLSGVYPNRSDFPDYNAHITLAYVKKGAFPHKKKVRLEIPITSICYSPISGGKSYWKLKENNTHYDIDSKIARLEQEWDRLDSTGTGIERQQQIQQELIQLRAEKAKQPLNPNDPRAKELWSKMKQSIR